MTNQNRNEQLKTINDMVKDVKFAMLTTVTSEGHLHACPMTTSDFNLETKEIWFIGDARTETVKDIKNNPQVNLAYTSNNAKDYLSINGKAQLINDPVKLEELWSAVYNAFFENGKEDKNVQLIKVIPNGAQYWLSGNAIVNMFKMTAAAVGGEKVADSLGENSSIEF